jgi:hypothetical protein
VGLWYGKNANFMAAVEILGCDFTPSAAYLRK